MTYTIPSHRRGDTWDGINSITLKVNGEFVNLTNCLVKIDFRESIDSPAVLTLSTQNSGITITSAASGTVRVEPFIVDIPFGKYYWDYQIIFPNESVKTYMEGTWTVTSDVTV